MKFGEKLRSLLLGTEPSPPEKRMTLDDYHQQVVKYAGNGYLLAGRSDFGNNTETVGHSFESYVNQGLQGNGIVFACSVARMMVFAQVRFMYQNMASGRPEDLEYDGSLRIFEKPWSNGATIDLLSKASFDVDYAGNHYAVVEGVGASKTIRTLRPDWVTIILSAPPEEAVRSDITGYVYRPGNTPDRSKWEAYPIDGSNGVVAHWAPYPDPLARYKGMSWLTPIVREIDADAAATLHKGKFFDNAATPTMAVKVPEGVTVEEFQEYAEATMAMHAGPENAYKPWFFGEGADVSVVGANIQQLDFKVTQGAGETRIAAAAGVHPVIVGLSEGMQGSSLNAGNFQAARRAFADRTMAFLWNGICSAYAVLVPEKRNKRLWYDARDVPFLREDMKDMAEIMGREAEIINSLIMSGWEPVSVVLAMTKQDWTLMKHSGLISVQLLPMEAAEDKADDVEDPPPDDKDEPEKEDDDDEPE